jgi:hypothetical protein
MRRAAGISTSGDAKKAARGLLIVAQQDATRTV